MNVFLWYILLGFSLAAPIGPVNAAQLDKGLKEGFLHAWFVGIGAMVADAFYMLFVFLGMVHLLDIPFIQSFLWLFGCFVLVYTGLESVLGVGEVEEQYMRSNQESLTKSFFAGFFVSLFNPLTILFWLGIFGSILAKSVTSFGLHQVILYSGAIFIGITLWDILMAGLASSMRKYLTTKLIKRISLISGLSLIGFGIYFGFQAFIVLFS